MIYDTYEPYGERPFQLLTSILHQILRGSVIFEPSKIRTNIVIMIRNFEHCPGFFGQLTSENPLTYDAGKSGFQHVWNSKCLMPST